MGLFTVTITNQFVQLPVPVRTPHKGDITTAAALRWSQPLSAILRSLVGSHTTYKSFFFPMFRRNPLSQTSGLTKKLSVCSGSLLALLLFPLRSPNWPEFPPRFPNNSNKYSSPLLHYPTWPTVSHPVYNAISFSKTSEQIITIRCWKTKPPQLLLLLTFCPYCTLQ